MTKLSDIPRNEHFVVLVGHRQTIHYPGDERSRTHPGHGYPAHDEVIESIEYNVVDEKELADFLLNLYTKGKSFRVIKAQPVEVEFNLNVKVGR